MHLECGVLDPEERIEGEIPVGVGITTSMEVGSRRQMAPATRLQFLGFRSQGRCEDRQERQ